jgi:hypothetical protein
MNYALFFVRVETVVCESHQKYFSNLEFLWLWCGLLISDFYLRACTLLSLKLQELNAAGCGKQCRQESKHSLLKYSHALVIKLHHLKTHSFPLFYDSSTST